MAEVGALLQRSAVTLIGFYRRIISPFLRPSCRFYPTCSSYTEEAIVLHGPVRGSWLGFKRILRCRPGGGYGHDPVPTRDGTQGLSNPMLENTKGTDLKVQIK